MLVIDVFKTIGNLGLKYRKVILVVFIIWSLWAFGLGMLGGWFLAKGTLAKFPDIQKQDRILIVAPHIDDEVISSAGLIQQAKEAGAKVLVVYATNGDDSALAILGQDKKFNPNDFIALGEKRMVEAKKAAVVLGLSQDELIFLGYPDGGLEQMLNKYFPEANPYTSGSTRLNYNPYHGTFQSEQLYTGSNLLTDIKKIMADFSPTIIIGPHLRDKHPDHKALFSFLEKAFLENKTQTKLYAYLVHYRFWPPEKKLKMSEFLYPPRSLFTAEGWYSFDLSTNQEQVKLQAINQNASQLRGSALDNFLRSFVKKNEIFEEIN